MKQPHKLTELLNMSRRISQVVDKIALAKSDPQKLLGLLVEQDYVLAVCAHSLQKIVKAHPNKDDTEVAEYTIMLVRIGDLRTVALTALVKPLKDSEFPQWAAELDSLGSELFRWHQAAVQAENAISEAHATPSRRELRQIFEKQQEELAKKFGDRYTAQVAQIGAKLFGTLQVQADDGEVVTVQPVVPNPLADPKKDEANNRVLRKNKHEFDKDLANMAEAKRFPTSEAASDEEAEIITQPIILAGFAFGDKAEEALIASGLKIVRIFGTYRQIHNAKLLTVPALLVPGNPLLQRRQAQAHLHDIAQRDHQYDGLRVAHAPSKTRRSPNPGVEDNHVCFILLPAGIDGVSITSWDFTNK